jgi:hypothetical protein
MLVWRWNVRRFLFQTWFGSGPEPPEFVLLEPCFKTEFPEVAFATNRGRELS